MDIKHENILRAPARVRGEAADEVAGNPDRDNHACKCRIIDFELSRKTDFTKERLKYLYKSYLRTMFKNLPEGMSVGQNNWR